MRTEIELEKYEDFLILWKYFGNYECLHNFFHKEACRQRFCWLDQTHGSQLSSFWEDVIHMGGCHPFGRMSSFWEDVLPWQLCPQCPTLAHFVLL
jgi:hypothetical protein